MRSIARNTQICYNISMPMRMSPNKSLLLEILKGRLPPPGTALDWPKILKIARHSAVSPSLYLALRGKEAELSMPAGTYQTMRSDYAVTALTNSLKLEKFGILASEFARNKIGYMPLKGAYLLMTVFGDDIGRRRIGDIDILVKKADLDKAGAILHSRGYRAIKTGSQKRPASMYTCSGDPDVRLDIHLHINIANISDHILSGAGISIDIDGIWDASIPAQAPEKYAGCRFMKNEHMLIALCEHGFRHAFARLSLLFDIHAFTGWAFAMLDWDKIKAAAVKWSLEKAVYQGIYLSRAFFGTEINEDFLKELLPGGLSPGERYFLERISAQDYPKESECPFLYLLSNKSFIAKAAFLKACIKERFGVK